MSGFLWHVAFIAGLYFLGVFTSKNLRRFATKFRADPRLAVDVEIANLQKFKAGLPF